MFYIAQLLVVLIAAAMAVHDAPAVDNFNFYGVKQEQMKEFHSANTLTKFLVCLGFSLLLCFNPTSFLFSHLLDAVILGVVNFFWMGLIFDPMLNIHRKVGDFKWYYISENDNTGKWLIKRFGKKAGKIKAGICAIAIVALNILYLFI